MDYETQPRAAVVRNLTVTRGREQYWCVVMRDARIAVDGVESLRGIHAMGRVLTEMEQRREIAMSKGTIRLLGEATP